MAQLTTHVLDLTSGRPANGVHLVLYRVAIDGCKTLIAQLLTDENGKIEKHCLHEVDLTPGVYEFMFSIGLYFKSNYPSLEDPLFLDQVPVRFTIMNSTGHYHIPLLISPFGYSTYRGS